jgi:hypothetical protein
MVAFGVNGDPVGVDIGNHCQRFYLGGGPLIIRSMVTPSNNTIPFLGGGAQIPYKQEFVGLEVWCQAGFVDNWRNFYLTMGGYASIAARPLAAFDSVFIWSPSAGSPTGSHAWVPALRLTYQ